MLMGPGYPPAALPAPTGGSDVAVLLVVLVAVSIVALVAILARRTDGDSPQAGAEPRQLERLGH